MERVRRFSKAPPPAKLWPTAGSTNKRRGRVASFIVGAGVAFASSEAHAYDVETPISDPCHERATLIAAEEAGVLDVALDVPLPSDDRWRELQARWNPHVTASATNEAAFVMHSLYLGVREPDTRGQSVADARNLRINHVPDGDDDPHCTRRAFDDGAIEDKTMSRCRDVVRDRLARMRDAASLPVDEQIDDVRVAVDFGQIDVPVWLPAYELGRALHTVQDSFSHTIRSPDMRAVRHVVNFVDALGPDYSEPTDGLRHSNTLDHCDGPTDEPFAAAIEASAALIEATFTMPAQGASEAVLVRWMSVEPGCDYYNGYCSSAWVEVAGEDMTQPVLPACSVRGERPDVWSWAALALLGIAVRSRRRRLLAACAGRRQPLRDRPLG